MQVLLATLLSIGIFLILVGGLIGRLTYKKRIYKISKPLFTPPPGVSVISPHIKNSLQIKVPRSIRTTESSEVMIEYFQGITYWPTEGLNTFLYDHLDILPRSLPLGLRGLFMSSSQPHTKAFLEKDFSAKLSSPRISIVPIEKIILKRGTKTPCRWRWSISCSEMGNYDLLFELSDDFHKKIPEELMENPIVFQVEIRSPSGLSLHASNVIRYTIMLMGVIITASVTLLASSPPIQEFLTKLLKPLLS